MTEESPQFDTRVLEYSIIGALLRHPDRAFETLAVRDCYFEDPALRKAFFVLRAMYEEDGSAALGSSSLIRSRLCASGFADDKAYDLIADAFDHAPESPAAIGRIVEEMSGYGLRRSLKEAAKGLAELAEVPQPIDVASQDAMRIVTEAVRSATVVRTKSLAEGIAAEIEIMERIERGDFHQEPGVSTGLTALDDIVGGFHAGELIVLGARPSMGKSALAGRFAWSMAVTQRIPGVIASLEMGRTQYVQRLLCQHAHCDIQRVQQRLLSPEDRQRYVEAARSVADVEWYIEDTGGISMAQLAGSVTRLYHEHGVRWVIVDYLQIMDHHQNKGESKASAVGRTANALKALAMSLEIPVIALSQLNRDCDNRENHRPRMSDLRESGDIEAAADVIMMLYRERMYWEAQRLEETRNQPEELAEVVVAKQRNGPTGTAKVGFHRFHASFHDLGLEQASAAEEGVDYDLSHLV